MVTKNIERKKTEILNKMHQKKQLKMKQNNPHTKQQTVKNTYT